jgi:thioredoxin 1
MIMIALHVTKENFETEVLKSDKPVLIDFWAPWCGPCKMLGPVVEEVAGETAGKAKVCKVNVDEQPEIAEAFGVSSIPTLVVMKDGKVTNAAVGFKPKASLLAMIA